MIGPTNGTMPSTVETHTASGSSMRRRAALKTQYTVAIQNTSTKKIARFRSTYHVDEWKNPDVEPSVATMDAVTAAPSLAGSPRQMRGRRTGPAGRLRTE